MKIVPLRKIWYMISGVTILASIISIGFFGLKLGIDFTGGSLLTVRFAGERPTVETLGATFSAFEIGDVTVQPVGQTDVSMRMTTLTEEKHQEILASVREQYGEVEELQFTSIGPSIGKELRTKSIYALALILLAIMAYVAWAFRKVSAPVESWKYGLLTIVAAFHDVVIPMGLFAILGYFYGVEIGTPFIAAVLTILGYSINDTIVVFDRVRENLRRSGGSFSEIIEDSVQQTLLRSLNTSFTTLLALFAVYFFGGESIKEFALALIVGIATGTYSSIFIASPLLVTVNNWKKR
ncbi:MAG: protein translocase subunit SecF [bacterium]|nr:protein translocase subunit SecF [bacterium]